MHPLAIVIPAYKSAYFDAALASIAAQTDKRFTVYVGDDASPDDLGHICRAYSDRIRLIYHRFGRNLGGQDLVAHWMRCIELSKEPWVWLFSDDDVMDPDCVAAFHRCLDEYGPAHELYHFNVVEIDAEDKPRREAPRFPALMPSLAFCLARLQGRLSSYVPDYIVARAALQREGGFEPIPLAWCADDATWTKVGRLTGIRSVGTPNVYWRRSGQNLTSRHAHLAQKKLRSAVLYLVWLGAYLRAHPPVAGEPDPEEIRLAARSWLQTHARHLDAAFWPRLALPVAFRLRHLFRFGVAGALFRTACWDLQRLRTR